MLKFRVTILQIAEFDGIFTISYTGKKTLKFTSFANILNGSYLTSSVIIS
jgi:hypothetical protein